MSNIIPFESAKVPSTITSMFGDAASELVGNNAGQGFPVISVKGKVFHIQRGDERVLVTKPGEDEPAGSIEVVVIRSNPNRSKVYYAAGYVEGSVDKPTCYSNDGVAPEADAQLPQSKKCATCPHNQWGAKVSESGKKMKACSDSRRLAVSTVETPTDPMLLRVPAASMKALEEYGKMLAARGLPPQAVVTKVGFDYSVAYPSLTFKPVGLIGDANTLTSIKRMRDEDIVAQIVGIKPLESATPPEDKEDPLPVIEPAAAMATAAKVVADDAVATAAAKSVKKPAVKPAPAAAPAPVAEKTVEASAALEEDITSMLSSLDFDN